MGSYLHERANFHNRGKLLLVYLQLVTVFGEKMNRCLKWGPFFNPIFNISVPKDFFSFILNKIKFDREVIILVGGFCTSSFRVHVVHTHRSLL